MPTAEVAAAAMTFPEH